MRRPCPCNTGASLSGGPVINAAILPRSLIQWRAEKHRLNRDQSEANAAATTRWGEARAPASYEDQIEPVNVEQRIYGRLHSNANQARMHTCRAKCGENRICTVHKIEDKSYCMIGLGHIEVAVRIC